jgi:hypothetical protein
MQLNAFETDIPTQMLSHPLYPMQCIMRQPSDISTCSLNHTEKIAQICSSAFVSIGFGG